MFWTECTGSKATKRQWRSALAKLNTKRCNNKLSFLPNSEIFEQRGAKHKIYLQVGYWWQWEHKKSKGQGPHNKTSQTQAHGNTIPDSTPTSAMFEQLLQKIDQLKQPAAETPPTPAIQPQIEGFPFTHLHQLRHNSCTRIGILQEHKWGQCLKFMSISQWCRLGIGFRSNCQMARSSMCNFCDCGCLGSTCWLPNWNSAYAFQKNESCILWINAIWSLFFVFLKIVCLFPLERTNKHAHTPTPPTEVSFENESDFFLHWYKYAYSFEDVLS